MKRLLSHATPARLLFSLVFITSACFLVDGRYSSAVAMLLLPVVVRAALVVADVFWTSFTGTPLLRARPEAGGHGHAALNQAEALGGLRGLSPLPRPIREESRHGVGLFEPLPQRRLASPGYLRARRRFIGRAS